MPLTFDDCLVGRREVKTAWTTGTSEQQAGFTLVAEHVVDYFDDNFEYVYGSILQRLLELRVPLLRRETSR